MAPSFACRPGVRRGSRLLRAVAGGLALCLAGCTDGAGGPLDSFGDPSLERGLFHDIIA